MSATIIIAKALYRLAEMALAPDVMDEWVEQTGIKEVIGPQPKHDTAENVRQLRNQTGASLRDCSKALRMTYGDLDKAIELLRTTGYA